MFKFLKKLNPFNWLESFVIRRMVKKIVKVFPSLKEKGLKIYEENKNEIDQKIKLNIYSYIEKYKNK